MQCAAEEVSQHDEMAVRGLLKKLIEGWNEGSGDAFATALTEDASLVGFDGTRLKGREEIASFHQALFDKFLRGSRFEMEVRSVRFLTPELSIIHAVGIIVIPEWSDFGFDLNSIQTLVAIKRAGEWLLVRFRMRGELIGMKREPASLISSKMIV